MANREMSPRERYFERLGLGNAGSRRTRQEAALERAYVLRSMEIELVWKRATYFLAVQTVLFAALGFASSKQFQGSPLLTLGLAMTGFATAWLGVLGARGARFWQQNWEMHIDLLEDEIEGRLHKIALYQGPVQFSVARTQIWLSKVLTGFWLIPVGMAWWEIADWLAKHGCGCG